MVRKSLIMDIETQFARVFDAGLPEFAEGGEITCTYNEYSQALQMLRERQCWVYTVQVIRSGYILSFDKPRLKQLGLL